MKVRITILCENSVGPISGTLGEHGFAALVEPAGGEPLLFDAGQGLTLLHNAGRMNRDLRRVPCVALSHGHYDHAGGLLPLLNECGPKQVFAHPGVFAPRFRVKDNGECVDIGMPHAQQDLELAGASFFLADSHRRIAPGIWLTGEIPRVTPFETGDAGLFLDCHGHVQDSIIDDQSLIIETRQGLVLLLGCCHAGLVNTLQHVITLTGRSDIHAIVGGMHLGFCSETQVGQTIAALRPLGVKKLAAAHCTGFHAAARIRHECPAAFQPAMVGYTVEF